MGAPTKLLQIELRNTTAGHHKFWEAIFYDSYDIDIRFGVIGTKGQYQTKRFVSFDAAFVFILKKAREKKDKRYQAHILAHGLLSEKATKLDTLVFNTHIRTLSDLFSIPPTEFTAIDPDTNPRGREPVSPPVPGIADYVKARRDQAKIIL